MPLSVNRVANITGPVVGEMAFTPNPHETTPQMLSVIGNPNHRVYSYWDLMPDGSVFETPVLTKNGNQHHLAIAAYNHQRVLTMDGSSESLRILAWETAGFFELNDDHTWVNDTAPVIITFGATPPVVSQLGSGPVAPPLRVMAAKSGGGASKPGSTRRTNTPVGGVHIVKVKVAKKFGLSIGPKVGYAVVGSITADNKLRLSLWMFDDGGEIQWNISKAAEAISSLAIKVTLVKLREIWSADNKRPTGLEFVAVISHNGKLRLERWRIELGSQGVPAAFRLLGEVTAPESIVSLSAASVESLGGTQVVTPVRIFSNKASPANVLRIIGWKMETDGSITRLSDLNSGKVTNLVATRVRGRSFVIAARTTAGLMKATYWSFPNSSAASFEKTFETEETSIRESFPHLRCLHFPGVAQNLGDTIIAARSPMDKLRMWRYRVTE